jgi:hypothetical protein
MAWDQMGNNKKFHLVSHFFTVNDRSEQRRYEILTPDTQHIDVCESHIQYKQYSGEFPAYPIQYHNIWKCAFRRMIFPEIRGLFCE